jgi:hypothetical protein
MELRNTSANGMIKYLEQMHQGSIKCEPSYTGVISNHLSAYRQNQVEYGKEDNNEKKK